MIQVTHELGDQEAPYVPSVEANDQSHRTPCGLFKMCFSHFAHVFTLLTSKDRHHASE